MRADQREKIEALIASSGYTIEDCCVDLDAVSEADADRLIFEMEQIDPEEETRYAEQRKAQRGDDIDDLLLESLR